MTDIKEISDDEIFIAMLESEARLPHFELASIAHEALYAVTVRGEDVPSVQIRYSKAMQTFLSNHMWD